MKLPKTVYIVVRKESTGEEYMIATETLDQHAEVGDKVKVGVYHLDETVMLSTKLHTDKVKK